MKQSHWRNRRNPDDYPDRSISIALPPFGPIQALSGTAARPLAGPACLMLGGFIQRDLRQLSVCAFPFWPTMQD
jgi:hypothetical protein